MTERNIFIFRADHHIYDNLALDGLDNVIPVFIFDSRQIKGKYSSKFAIQYMLESLERLDSELEELGSSLLYLDSIENLPEAKSVTMSLGMTPFAKKRENEIKEYCDKNNMTFKLVENDTLIPIGSVLNSKKKAQTIRSRFIKAMPEVLKPKKIKVSFAKHDFKSVEIPEVRKLQTMEVSKSAQVRFGVKSCRQFYWEGDEEVKEGLSSREFYYHLFYLEPKFLDMNTRQDDDWKGNESDYYRWKKTHKNYPDLKEAWINGQFEFYHKADWIDPKILEQYKGKKDLMKLIKTDPKAVKKEIKGLKGNWIWEGRKEDYENFCQCKTDSDYINACINKLICTGFIDNKLRLDVSQYLCNVLKVDWRLGAKFFAQHLVDHDYAVNIGNWMWSGESARQYKYSLSRRKNLRLKIDPDFLENWKPTR